MGAAERAREPVEEKMSQPDVSPAQASPAGTAQILDGTQPSDPAITKIPTILRPNTQSEATQSVLQFIKQEMKRTTAEIEAINKKTAQTRQKHEILEQRKRNIIAGMRKAAESAREQIQ